MKSCQRQTRSSITSTEYVRSRPTQGGQALLEFAFASILFFMVLFGIVEFGLVIWQYNALADLSQEGARWASVHGADSSTPASTSAVQDYVRSRAVTIATVTVTTTSIDSAQACTTVDTAPSTLHAGDGVCVKVTIPFTRLTTLVSASPATLQSQSQMVMAR